MKKLLNKLNFKKFVAVFTSITFIFTGVVGNTAFASVGSSMPAINNVHFDTPIIPTSLGKITSAKYFDSEDIIINIQDLHCHAETQRKIASIIGYIDNIYNLNNVYLEGAFKTVDTSWLSSFNNNKNGTKILEGLIDSGKLSGTEYYSIVNNKKDFVLGIEDEALYKENIKLLGAILSLQPEVNAICSQLEKEISKIKRDYSSKQARKLEKLIKSYKNKEIDAKHYYAQLTSLASGCNLSISKYPNIKIYISLLDKAQYVNNKKVIYEFSKFISEIKNVLPYQQYSDLVKKSNNFNNLDDISLDLIELNKKYAITTKLKLTNFENFLAYLEFNHNINPIQLIQEEESFINELYVKLGRTKYEKEVAFLFEFIPTIKQYFTADISADEYYKFEKNYELFKNVWPAYFSESTVKNLEPYRKLLSKYHKNNITRDKIFADSLISKKNMNNNVYVNDTTLAINKIKTNLNNKKIKLVVTGGFHTRGLERIFEQQKISYVIITPKITQPIEQAKQIYIDNVMYYSNILKNTINLEPLTQEPLNVSFPKILNLIFLLVQDKSIFGEYSKQEDIIAAIKGFVGEYITDETKQESFYGDVRIQNWDIISNDLTGKIEFFVEYVDNANNGMISNVRYQFVDGIIVPYSSIDIAKTKSMLERITNNKYAQPSIELEPTNATRKKIAKHILEPLQKVIGNAITLMPLEQLHLTVGYDSTPMTQQEIESLVQEGDTSAEIFSILDVLGQDFVNFRTSMAGTLKLMSDGVIIYEITDKDLIEKMLGFRTTLKDVDVKYKTPRIVHITIGRMSNLELLDGSEQSKQELANLLEKINETIYEINKKNALAKIKTTFTLKSGYVSSTGDKDFVVRRILPNKESLILFKNIINSSKSKLNLLYKVVVAPIIEEVVFRFVPFIITGLIVSNPVSIAPMIVTGIIGILGFSFAHPLADKINNYFYEKIEQGKITNKFISKLFAGKVPVRKMRSFLLQSVSLTYIFLAISFVFPQLTLVALSVSIFYHSLNNFFVLRQGDKLPLLSLKQGPSNQKNLDFEKKQIIEKLEEILSQTGHRHFSSDFKDTIRRFTYHTFQDEQDKEALAKKVLELFNFVKENHIFFDAVNLNTLLEPILNISAYLNDEDGNPLFDKIFDYIFQQATKSNSSYYHEILIASAKYFYKADQIGYVHKIIDSLYGNKHLVKNMMGYGKVALPLPSPFSSNFSSVKEWEEEIYRIMMEEDVNANWYLPILEIFLASSVTNPNEYAKALIRALYKSGKQKEPPYIKGVDAYEFAKTFYEICGITNDIFTTERSIPLLDEENIKLFADNAEILKTNNLYLSDIISRLKYLKQSIPYNGTLNSDQYSQIIEKLTAALSLTKQEQIDTITEQMNELVNLLLANKCFKDTKILEILTPILIFIKNNKTGKSLLTVVDVDYNFGTIVNEDAFFRLILFAYDINKQEALFLISKLYSDSRKKDLFGANWKYWRPENLQTAYEILPVQLRSKMNTYADLELFFYTIGIEFDSIEEQSSLYERRDYVPEYELLLSKLPASVFERKHWTRKYFRSLRPEILSTQTISEDRENLPKYFEALERVLDNNILALSEVNKANKDSMKDAFIFVEEMINAFAILNENAAAKARASLERIKGNFTGTKEEVAEIGRLRGWTVENMDNIKELHTLINAVHQTAIASLMNKFKHSRLGSQSVFKEDYGEFFYFFDCSETKISKQMEDFIAYLKLGGFLSQDIRVVAKDNKLLYSKSLGAHSVDVMVDLNEGIRVTFNDSDRGDGNALRVLLLSSLFAQAGFVITNLDTKTDTREGICSFSAMISLPKKALNNGIEYAKYFEQALSILGNTKDLDFELEGRDEDGDRHSYGEYLIPNYDLERINKLKYSTDIPAEFTLATMPQERFNEKQTNNPERSKMVSTVLARQWLSMSNTLKNLRERQSVQDLDSVYEYLGIKDKSKRNVWRIVGEYVKGRLRFNEKGMLERNEGYDGIDILLRAINDNVGEASRKSQLINLLDFDEMNFETEGYIGGMVALSGLLRLDEKGWLSIKVAVDKERKRAKFAYVEFVDFSGNRTPLTYEDLIKKLREFDYVVKEQKPRSSLEIKEAITVLKERILYPKDGIYTRGMGVSGQADKYIPVRITYDKTKVTPNSMWVVAYTTPDDVESIRGAGAIMTTSGGMLSHANITARESKKTAILSNGHWVDGKLEVPFYRIESGIQQHGEYETQIISEESVVLEEGDVVLANGINGRVLVYKDKDIPRETIDAIQKAIDENDLNFIENFIMKHKEDKNIRLIVEYIFLQVITDKEKLGITQFLLNFPEETEIGKKIYELKKVSVGETIKAVKSYIKNEKKIKDARIRFAIIKFIEQELEALKYLCSDGDETAQERQEIQEELDKDKKLAIKQIDSKVQRIIKKAKSILFKSTISEEEKEILVKISEVAKVWKFYGNSQIRELVSRIDSIISSESGESYETEIRSFEDIRAKDVVRYGTKTTELAKISKFFKEKNITIASVPDGTGISKDVLRIFFEHNGLLEEYLDLMSAFQQAIKDKNKDEALRIGHIISKRIEELDDKELEEFLKSKLEDGKKYAVRSSGVGEDGENHAFAGMAKTELNVDKKKVYSTVKQGWKSFFTDTCIEDMIKNEVFVQPALLIQEMVSGVEKAGVIFTRDNSGNLTVEAVLGLGEGLVSGRITPDHIIVKASDGRIEYRRALNNMIKVAEKKEGGTEITKLSKEEKIERILDEEAIKQLKKVAYLLEEDSGYPVDIEFAIDKDGKIFVLQRRAITTIVPQGITSIPVIEQSLIDETITALSSLSKNSYTGITEIIDQLSNLPETVNERYEAVIEQILNLVEVIKSSPRSNKKLIPILVPFVTMIDIHNSDKLLFYSIIDSLFYKKGMKRDAFDILTDVSIFMGLVYSISPDFIPYIVNKLILNQILGKGEEMPYLIKENLDKYGYDAVKQYYFAMSSKYKVDEQLSKFLLQQIEKIDNDLLPLITNKETKRRINKILLNINELSDKINIGSMPLLEQLLNSLLKEAIALKNVNREASFQIIKVVLSVCEQISSSGININPKILDIKGLKNVLMEEYDNNSATDFFNDVISQLISIVQPKQEKDEINTIISEMLMNIALHIYEPIASKEIEDQDSQEYKAKKKLTLDIFRRLALKRVSDSSIYHCLFNNTKYNTIKGIGVGFTPETLEIFINSIKRGNNIFTISLPNEEFISGDLEQMADMIVDSIENINPLPMFKYAFSIDYYDDDDDDYDLFPTTKKAKDKAEKLSIYVISKLLDIAKDENISISKRKRAVLILLETLKEGIEKRNIQNVPIEFEQVKDLAYELNIPVYMYLGDTSVTDRSDHAEYAFTPLVKFIPETILEKAPLFKWQGRRRNSDLLKNKGIVFTTVEGQTNPTAAKVQQLLIRFEVLQKILQYNISVLSLMDKLQDSKNYEKNMESLLNELQLMINELKNINAEHGNAAQEALDNIILSLGDTSVSRKAKVSSHLRLSNWTTESIKDIKEIHTLINAVHQTSIADFKGEIGDIKEIGSLIQVITAQQKSTIKGYNLSNTTNPNIIRFLSRLSTRTLPEDGIDDFICKDDLVVWTTRLNSHSVDIFFNFGEADRGITIYYRERPVSSENVGKKERIRYFKEFLEYLGFHVETDTQLLEGGESYGLKATLNKDFGMNENMDLIDIAIRVIETFKFSTNLDYDLKYKKEHSFDYEKEFKKLLNKAKRGEMYYGVDIKNQKRLRDEDMGQNVEMFYGYGQMAANLTSIPRRGLLNVDLLNEILAYLGCDPLPQKEVDPDLPDPITDSTYIDKYFNKPIERAYIEGRIKFNDEGVLVRTPDYDIVHSTIKEITADLPEASIQSRILNLVNSYSFDTRILANIGSFVIISSIMELKSGDKLFIRAIMDPKTKRMKYTVAEKVTSTTRKTLTNDELIEILSKEEYSIPEQEEWVETRGRTRIRNMLSRQIQIIESPTINSTPTSDGTGVSIVGTITFDKNKVDENSILVVPYTTPDDIEYIKRAKGIITTGGGVLSHAAITTRELKKPSVVFNGATWSDDELEILYYLASGEVEIIDDKYPVQRVETTRMMLKEGSKVLMNGETGTVLFFDRDDEIIPLLDELQTYIDSDNSQAVIDFMNRHSQDKDINRLVEYVYFQVIGNDKTINVLDSLFSDYMPEIVKSKVNKLNDGYIQDKVQSITEAIENLKTIDNANIAYMVLQELNKKLKFIKTVGTRQDIENLKKQIEELEVEIKDNLNAYMQKFIKDMTKFISKNKLSTADIQQIITMLKNVEIYNYFVSETETSEELLTKKNMIQSLVPLLKEKLNAYTAQKTDIDLQDEISLFEENAENDKLFGSKTAQLAKLFKMLKGVIGVIVPRGIGISVNVMPMLFKALGKSDLLTAFENAIKNKDKKRAMELGKEICELLDSQDLRGTELEKEIIKQLNKLIKPGQKYSVRSSGVGEDSTNNAFAGMGETKLNVGYDDIYENVIECWKSFFAERCIDYMISSGQVVKPAVLVEEMVDSEISGVVFSRDKYGNGRLNVLFGQGEGLVSGMLEPDSVLFDMSTGEVIEYLVANKYFKLVTDATGGLKKVLVGQNAKSRAMNSDMIKKLAQTIKLLEDSVGYPIDVEFAIKGNEIYVLQMRPITTLDNKEQIAEIAGAGSKVGEQQIQSQEIEIKRKISLISGTIDKGQEIFVNIPNPLDTTKAIPIYIKAVNTESGEEHITEFIVDSQYEDLVKNSILGNLLLNRINTDPAILKKLNKMLFVFENYKPGELGLLPVLDEVNIDGSLSGTTSEIGIEQIRSLLASA